METLRTRKNYYELTSAERDEFIASILALKASGQYDSIVKMHQDAMDHSTPWDQDARPNRRNAAHRGPAFLLWHRQYLLIFEQALQDICGNGKLNSALHSKPTLGRNMFVRHSIATSQTDARQRSPRSVTGG